MSATEGEGKPRAQRLAIAFSEFRRAGARRGKELLGPVMSASDASRGGALRGPACACGGHECRCKKPVETKANDFFSRCDRDEGGHCKPGTGAGGQGGEEEAGDDEAREAWDAYDEELADYRQARADFEAAHAAWEEATDALLARHQEQAAAWRGRQEKRDARRAALDAAAGGMTLATLDARDAKDPDRSADGTAEGYAAASVETTSAEGKRHAEQAAALGFDAKGQAAVEKAAARNQAAVEKAAGKYRAAAGAADEARAALAAVPDRPEPEEPEEPEEPPDPNDWDALEEPDERAAAEEDHARWRKDHAAWEDAHAAWEKDMKAWEKEQATRGKLEGKVEAAEGKEQEAHDALDGAFDDADAAMIEAWDAAADRAAAALDAEESADDEPEEPPGPDEPEYDGPDEPDEPDVPRPEEKKRWRPPPFRRLREGERLGLAAPPRADAPAACLFAASARRLARDKGEHVARAVALLPPAEAPPEMAAAAAGWAGKALVTREARRAAPAFWGELLDAWDDWSDSDQAEGKAESFFGRCERDEGGRCKPGGGSGPAAGSDEPPVTDPWGATAETVSRRPDGLPDPQSRDGIRFIALSLRRAVYRASRGDVTEKCVDVAHAIRHLYPEAETWAGHYRGREDQAHTIVRLGGKYIDVTADQFGHEPKVVVLSELPPGRYRDFEVLPPGHVSSHQDVLKILDRLKEAMLSPPGEKSFRPREGKALDGTYPAYDGQGLDLDARAEWLAELLWSIYGDDALAFLADEAEGKAWDESQHPRGEDGRFVAVGSSAAGRAAKEAVSKALAGKKDRASLKETLQHLGRLTVAQLKELHREHGTGKMPSGLKKDQLVAAVRSRLEADAELAGLREEFAQVRGARPPDTMTPDNLRRQIEAAKRPKEKPKEKTPSPEKSTPAVDTSSPSGYNPDVGPAGGPGKQEGGKVDTARLPETPQMQAATAWLKDMDETAQIHPQPDGSLFVTASLGSAVGRLNGVMKEAGYVRGAGDKMIGGRWATEFRPAAPKKPEPEPEQAKTTDGTTGDDGPELEHGASGLTFRHEAGGRLVVAGNTAAHRAALRRAGFRPVPGRGYDFDVPLRPGARPPEEPEEWEGTVQHAVNLDVPRAHTIPGLLGVQARSRVGGGRVVK